ncbi:anaerobic sulfatase maturase [Leclercia sp. LSNIH1]|uniref:anaerobic sulfatase maturase n=1 Tax=Leclercia sp. LSNIH1 TaxID=1920114 RepID=UPI000CD3151B|nr:anaerobic sulfatase maturase [Leclercia sp. LSNIH1]AUU86090.1 anaerobic sulfatase maturase [Leclercia sp. LSNIH1]POV36384.1 anaerobic sulfatase maturase [Leclercia sp. LSNIH5]POW68672.1 anaerobic sulfatase maturase [Leclercia sp. LSNIH2]
MSNNFNTVAKPGGNLCNVACDYCFYLKNNVSRPACTVMDDETLGAYIQNTIASTPSMSVEFCWQGGEPTLCGLAFFEQVVALQQRYRGNKTIHNSLQTNGILLDDKWARFLKENDFLVGLSIDGPASLHDAWRKTRAGKPSWKKVVQAIRCLQQHDVPVNAMVVVSHQSETQGQTLYRCLTRKLDLRHIQFIPLVEPAFPWSVTPEGWGEFLCAIFNEWLEQDVGEVFIQFFDNLLGVWTGQPATLCTMQPTCGQSLLVEKNGDVYSCDHFVSPEYKLGNLKQDSMAVLASSPFQRQFGQEKARLSSRCMNCHWRFACHGGCPKHRIIAEGNEAQNYLCEGYLAFFRHITPYMNVMRTLLLNHQPPALVMKIAPEIRAQVVKLTESGE